MSEIKPIKRSTQLQPLSREHHDGLLFIWKLRQGLNNYTPPETLKQFIIWYWKNHIKPHFYQEEKVLLPHISHTDPLAVRMKEEHEYIRELILSISQEPSRQDISRLCDLVESHIRFEEREFFGALELTLSEKELNDIHLLLEEKPVSCQDEWQQEFWVRKKAGN